MQLAIMDLAKINGFAWTFADGFDRAEVRREGVHPFFGTHTEVLAFLQGWDRCARHKGRS